MALMDQPMTEALPPAWVPANVMNYSHLSFDLNILYNVVKKIAAAQLGAGAVDAQEAKADEFLQPFLGTNVKKLINSFGKKIYQLNFGLEMQKNTSTSKDVINALPVDKTAIIIEFDNDEVMNKVMAMVAPFVAQEGFTRTKEQGFDGYRIDLPVMKGSVFYGKKKIVISIGEGTTETVLSALANPPQGADALLTSRKFMDFVKQENPAKSSLFSYGDASKMAPMLYGIFSEMVPREEVLGGISNEKEKAFVKDLMDLLPTESDVDGIFGISHSIGMPIQSGFIFKTSVELP